MNPHNRTSSNERFDREPSRRTSPASKSTNWRCTRPSQNNTSTTSQRAQPFTSSGHSPADDQHLGKVKPEDLARGQILWLPSKTDLWNSEYTTRYELGDGAHDRPVLVRQIWEDSGRKIILELQLLTSFGGKPINEKYKEGDNNVLKDRRRAMFIEHSKNKSGRDVGKWDNSDCPQKLQFQHGETPLPSYVRLDKILFFELEYVRHFPQLPKGCSITMASLELLMTKAPTPKKHGLSLKNTPASNQVSFKDLQKMMESNTQKRRSMPEVNLQPRAYESNSFRKTKSMEKFPSLVTPLEEAHVEHSSEPCDTSLVAQVSKLELSSDEAILNTTQVASKRASSSKENPATIYLGPRSGLLTKQTRTLPLKA